MNRRHLWAFLAIVVAAAWAVSSALPAKNTPFRDYAHSQLEKTFKANATQNTQASASTIKELFAEADTLVEKKVYTSFYGAFKALVKQKNVDLQPFFPSLNARDVHNINKRNELILNELLKRSQSKFRLGLDLAGGVSFTFKVDVSKLESDHLKQEAISKAKEIITQRIDGLGVAEPVVREVGDDAIEVQMPGLSLRENPSVADTLQAPAKLEFSLVSREAIPGEDEAPLGFRELAEEIEDPITGEVTTRSLFVKNIPEMTGSAIAQAFAVPSDTGSYRVALRFTDEGGREFAKVTRGIAELNNATNTIGQLAIILDGKLYSAPTVREAIVGGNAEISGRFTQREAIELANVLNNPLEVGLTIDSMTEVGPTLANQARDASLNAALLGIGIVVIFMLGYYGWMGIASVAGIAFTLMLILGSMAGIGATFTLPGIAALVLTIGMAVDSNILIFERIREELKNGRSLWQSIESGHAKAFSTIFDANLTTLITALLMAWLGSGPVKGFGVILSIGILSTLFSTLVLCRTLIEMGSKLFKKALRIDLFQIRGVNFMGFAPIAFILSWAVIAFGMTHFVQNFDKAWGIDFKGGEELTCSFDTDHKLSTIQIEEATKELGEVNAIYQSLLGESVEHLRLQTATGMADTTLATLQKAFPESQITEISRNAVGATVGKQIQHAAIISVTVALLAMLLYIAFRFEIGYGVGAVVATLHDLLMTVGLFFLFDGQFSAPMIASLLLVIGYSINDTIVVFDRVREELKLNPHLELNQVINLSINVTLSRTILTGVTTLLATGVLYTFGAGVVSDYALVFLLGILTGTYSSIFIAAPIFYWWHKGNRRSVEEKADPISTAYTTTTDAV